MNFSIPVKVPAKFQNLKNWKNSTRLAPYIGIVSYKLRLFYPYQPLNKTTTNNEIKRKKNR
jgi:hypothetical protein